MRSQVQRASRWLPTWQQGAAAGLCALLALSLHGAIALADQQGPGLDRPSDLCYFLAIVFLQPDLSTGTPPVLTVAAWWVEESSPSAASALLTLLPSRGPPA